jgi:cell division protein FtsB
MSGQQWRRFIPTGSQFIILGVVAVSLFAVVSFFNLTMTKGEALAKQAEAQIRLDLLKAQRQELEAALAQAQRGDHIESQARRYFNFSLPGETVIVLKRASAPVVAPAATSRTAAPPYWSDWWRRLANP